MSNVLSIGLIMMMLTMNELSRAEVGGLRKGGVISPREGGGDMATPTWCVLNAISDSSR